ncbi:MAG TPA: ABC transporter permease [Terriglobia bacterium]|nr:ABC transporter permease [Terriglobia bacterium]
MTWLRIFRRAGWDRERARELKAHLELEIDDNLARGLSPEEARYAAQRKLGNPALIREEIYQMNSIGFLETFRQDLRYAIRRLRQTPGFTALCIVTLALGIGANTAIFTLVDALMLKSLPVANPGQLYRLGDNNNCCTMTSDTQNGGSWVLYSYPFYRELRDHTGEFSELTAFEPSLTDLSVRRMGAAAPASPYEGELVSGNYFATFGVGAFAGRALTAADDKPGAAPTAVMSYHTWQARFGADPSIVGAAFTINAGAYTIAGVAPAGFYGDTLRSDPPDFWLPLATETALDSHSTILNRADLKWLYLIGRLKPDARTAAAQSHLTVELHQWLWQRGWESATAEERNNPALVAEARKEIAAQHVHLTPAGGGVQKLQEDYAAGLRLLLAIAGLVLLIACANIANLLLARGAIERSQRAVRLALGAPRARLIRQMLTESILLAGAGGVAGLYVAYAGTHTILALAFRGAHYVPISARPSLPVLVFALVLSLATGIVFGVAPAWIGSRCDPADALRGASRSSQDRPSRFQKPLVVTQVVLSMVLLVGAGLLAWSLRNLEAQHFGFITGGRLMVKVDTSFAGHAPEKLLGLYREMRNRLVQIPGVFSASLSLYSPMEGDNWNEPAFIEGRAGNYQTSWDRVSAGYFETIGTRLVLGRAIAERDTPAAQHVAVVNQTFASRVFPHQNPVGQHLGLGGTVHSGDYEIVGVVEDAKYQDARAPAYPTVFLPLLQLSPSATKAENSQGFASNFIGDVELHVAGSPENLEPAVRRTLAGIDPNLTVLNMMSFGEQVARNFNQERMIARLAELFGALALILACVGLYGVTSYTVARRTNEIGIRMALGAGRTSVLGLVLRGALAQVALGLAIGIPVALAGGRLLASELYGVKDYDPVILGLTAGTLAACAVAAALLPARRATKVDPIKALRYD